MLSGYGPGQVNLLIAYVLADTKVFLKTFPHPHSPVEAGEQSPSMFLERLDFISTFLSTFLERGNNDRYPDSTVSVMGRVHKLMMHFREGVCITLQVPFPSSFSRFLRHNPSDLLAGLTWIVSST